MASRDGEGSPPAIDQDEQQQSTQPESPENDESGSESGSSYDGTASGPGTPACTYRNPQFHDQECSRYFDCPTHQVERAQFDDESHQLESREESREQQSITPDSQDTPPEDDSPAQPPGSADIMSVPTSVDTATDDQASAGTQQASGTDQPAAESNIDREDTAEIATEEEAGADLNNAASTTEESSPPREPAADNDLAIRRACPRFAFTDNSYAFIEHKNPDVDYGCVREKTVQRTLRPSGTSVSSTPRNDFLSFLTYPTAHMAA
ncbi:hypothetical protein LQW54_011234 [Pestalotiopsis sp. IQ-011]